jgi:hypothetical protein
VPFWAHRLENVAANATDNPEEGWVPVVLAVDISEADVHSDDIGTKDALAQAYFTVKPIPPERITVFDKQDGAFDLVMVADADPDEMLEDVLRASEFVEEDGYGEDNGFWEIDYEYFLPDMATMKYYEEA